MRPRVWLAAILVALLQTGVIAYIIVNRAIHLAHGREIVLDAIPVDPRDLLRGDYVRLGYAISRLPGPIVQFPAHPHEDMPIFVTLERQEKTGEEKWVAVAATPVRPALPDTDSKIVLKGSLQWWYPYDADGRTEHGLDYINLKYGIESYFVQESTGLALERLTREGAVKTVVSVDRDGMATIKGIVVEGKRHDETLF